MNEVTVHSWNELIEQLYGGAWNPQLERFRSPFVFRGLSIADQKLDTSLCRLGGSFAKVEPHLLRNFRKYARHTLPDPDNFWHWISLAQHHGLPTRLLDWTLSPLVAAHFATANTDRFDEDGAIWAVNHVEAHKRLPEQFRKALDEEGADVFTVEMLDSLAPSLAELDHLSTDAILLFFEPPSLDDRIVNQYALFSVLSDAEARMNSWLEQHPDLWRKIYIPAKIKWEVRDKLDQANITERVLLPGLDGLSLWLKRYYSPKEPD